MIETIPYNSITLEGLASILRNRFSQKKDSGLAAKGAKIAVLIGAGASASSGIPLATELVNEIRKRYPEQVKNCAPTYAAHMARLPSVDRTNILRPYIKDAAVNAAHLYLAHLVSSGFIDRILTTNFDTLAVQGLILVNERPNIYDLANMKTFSPGQITAPSVIHLHGQFGGFVNLNTYSEFAYLGDLVKDVIRDTLSERALIIIGYGGVNDPVFKQICEYGEQYGEYYNGLFWISNEDSEPPSHVLNDLLSKTTKNSFYLRGYNADSFFMSLVNELNCGIPEIIEKPFTFLKKTVIRISDKYEKDNVSFISGTRKIIDFAIECHESNKSCARGHEEYIQRKMVQIEKKAQDARNGMQIEKIEKILLQAKKYNVKNAIDLIAETYIEYAHKLLKDSFNKEFRTLENSVLAAISYYQRAIELQPENKKINLFCGKAFTLLAKNSKSSLIEKNFSQAILHFKEASKREIKLTNEYIITDGSLSEIDIGHDLPDFIPEVYIEWAQTLFEWGNKLAGENKIKKMKEAKEKCDHILQMRPTWDVQIKILLDKLQDNKY